MKKIISLVFISLIISSSGLHSSEEDVSTILITGSNRNIGLEFVKQFSQKGWRVIATTRSLDSADDLIEFSNKNRNVIVEQLDITNDAHLQNLKKKYQDDVVDILLNNAAYTPRYFSSFRGIEGDRKSTRLNSSH